MTRHGSLALLMYRYCFACRCEPGAIGAPSSIRLGATPRRVGGLAGSINLKSRIQSGDPPSSATGLNMPTSNERPPLPTRAIIELHAHGNRLPRLRRQRLGNHRDRKSVVEG